MGSRVRDSVLRAISDDYESVEIILRAVRRLDGLEATPEQVYLALGELVREGLAQAYELSTDHPYATAVNIDFDRMKELWFYATAKGIARVEINNRQLTTDN